MIDVYRTGPAPTKAPNLEYEIFSRRWDRASYSLKFYMDKSSLTLMKNETLT